MTRIPLPQVAGDSTGASWSSRLLTAHNVERQRAGLPPYGASAVLDACAQDRVTDMVAEQYFGHADPNQSPGNYVAVLARHGVTAYRWAGENLAMNNYPDVVDTAMRGLMASPGHRANILAIDFDRVGFAAGIRNDTGAHVIACLFTGGASV